MSMSSYQQNEPTPYCSHEMTMEELLHRRSFLKKSIQTYYSNIENMNHVCPVDPLKFKKLKAYEEKRLQETEEFIRKKNDDSSYTTCSTV